MQETAEGSFVDYRKENGIAVLELNNPPANVYNHEVLKALDKAILRARFDEDVHVLVITGKGEKFFCAGADVKDMISRSPKYRYYFGLHGNEVLMRLENTPKLVIAAINGHALGGGLEIALACDLRLARKDGGNLGLPEVNLGLLPGMGGTQRLSRVVGKGRAIELMVTGRSINFEEGLELGILNDIMDRHTFREDVMAYARQFVPPQKASRSVGSIKRSVQTGWEVPLPEGLALERELLQQVFDSQDAQEGITAFIEKRMPTYKGE